LVTVRLWLYISLQCTFSRKEIFGLANERRLRRDKPLEEFQGHISIDHFAI
jgi:hypothetical protein